MKLTENIEEKFTKWLDKVEAGDERYRGFAYSSGNQSQYKDGETIIKDLEFHYCIWDDNGTINHYNSRGDASNEGQVMAIIKEDRKAIIKDSKAGLIPFGFKNSEDEKQVFAVIYLCDKSIATLIVADSKLPRVSVIDYFTRAATDKVDKEHTCDPVLNVLRDLFARIRYGEGEEMSDYARDSGSESAENFG